MKFLVAMYFILILQPSLSAQRHATTNSGQKFYILADGAWKYHHSENLDLSLSNSEIPYKPFMTAEMIDQFRIIIKETEIKEILAFMVVDSLNREMDHKKLKISQAKRLNNKLEQRQFEKELKILENKINMSEKLYISATKRVNEARNLRFQEKEEFLKKIKMIAQGLNIQFSENLIQLLPPVISSDQNSVKTVIKKSKIFSTDCKIVKNVIEGKKRIIEMSQENIFNFTPEKLKSYFKDKELMIADAAIIKENNITKLRLHQKLISKDASKNYGHIPYEALMRITLISGKKIDIYSLETSYGEIENYTGHVVYKTDFLLKDGDIKSLADVPLDTIGLMWTSGFETYIIYNVDVIMKQLSCLKKVVN